MKAAIVGGGVIGGGWAARFLLNGWDVAIFDPDPEAQRKIGEVLNNARRSLPALYDAALPAEGRLTFHQDLATAVTGAQWIQESVPERLAVKRGVLAEIQQAAPDSAVIGSSTSGFRPSQLQERTIRPGQILVCHPFNPVYLLPLVEVVPSPRNDPDILRSCQEILTGLGMKPLLVRREIDAHIADRLMEAVWREALWLINDDIATTAEIDDAIRHGFGLRWAQMGLFETYRIAGGEAGMRHFIQQFGPALKWPWTKLMDVPDLRDELVENIAQQSDAQSGRYSIRELERIRDDNLVAILRGLKRAPWGAGEVVASHETRLPMAEEDFSQPITTVQRSVPMTWTDYNDHMNETHYLEVFAQASDRFMVLIGADADYIATGSSYFTLETHLRHLDEIRAGERVRITTQMLAGEGKKLQLFHQLYREDGALAATGEHLLVHVDLETRKSSLPGEAVAAKLAEIAALHGRLSVPEGAGRFVGQPAQSRK